jgi:fructosamine-3-kinase
VTRPSPCNEVAALLGETVVDVLRLQGGDLSEVVRVRLASARSVVAKLAGTARQEAAMLDAIRSAGAPAPAVLAVTDGLLVLEDLGEDEGAGSAWGDLGCVARRLHAATGPRYGWTADYSFGALPIPNAPLHDWPAFWAERRLLAHADRLPSDLAARVERLSGRLCDLLPRAPRASLLHGDLWTGNVMAREGRVKGLIDPACCYGDAEADLAMLCLFASPPSVFWEGYGTTAAGLEDRRPVYQLWPALVHLHLLGAGYRGLVQRLLTQLGA